MPMYPRRKLYPENWPEIAREIKTAAGWRCEECAVAHDPAHGYCLTVHHIDGDPGNNVPENLVALCQRCHLRLHGKKRVGQLMFRFIWPSWLEKRRKNRT